MASHEKDATPTATHTDIDPRVFADTQPGQNPLTKLSYDEVKALAENYVDTYNVQKYREAIIKGVLIAKDPANALRLPQLDDADRLALRREVTLRFTSNPWSLWWLVIMCSVAAATQRMDATVINGANLFYPSQFGIAENELLIGLVNATPSLASFSVGCWLADPLCYYTGRRDAIFIVSFITFISCFWQGLVNSWWHLLIARFVMGVGVGPEWAIVPEYTRQLAAQIARQE